MAGKTTKNEKHKSKYKKPEQTKHQPRKDLKDYEGKETEDMVPDSTNDKQLKVPRRNSKQVIDDVENMVPKQKDSEYKYKGVKDGEYDPKHAAKVFKQNQEIDTKEYLEKIKQRDGGVTTPELQEKLSKLSESSLEKLVRKYVRRKIELMVPTLTEQQTADEEDIENIDSDLPIEDDEQETTNDIDVDNNDNEEAELDSEGIKKQYQKMIIRDAEDSTADLVGIVLDLLDETLNHTASEDGIDKDLVKRYIFLWMQRNKYLQS